MCAGFHVCQSAYVDMREYMYTHMQCMYVREYVYGCAYARVCACILFLVACVRVGACVSVYVYV